MGSQIYLMSQINAKIKAVKYTDNIENNVSEILKEIYSKWFFEENNFNNPITKHVCRKIKHILPHDDGGGLVQHIFY
jgi:hypothetical protein